MTHTWVDRYGEQTPSGEWLSFAEWCFDCGVSHVMRASYNPVLRKLKALHTYSKGSHEPYTTSVPECAPSLDWPARRVHLIKFTFRFCKTIPGLTEEKAPSFAGKSESVTKPKNTLAIALRNMRKNSHAQKS